MTKIIRYRTRKISNKQGRTEILEYFKKYSGKDTLDAALYLKINPILSFDICDRLVKEGRLEGVLGRLASPVQ